MKKALDVLATSIIICHNHPSGNLQPSRADEELTQKIRHGALFFDITVLDHIILTEDSYYSFADDGKM
jgi:DNA repair protein RadC